MEGFIDRQWFDDIDTFMKKVVGRVAVKCVLQVAHVFEY